MTEGEIWSFEQANSLSGNMKYWLYIQHDYFLQLFFIRKLELWFIPYINVIVKIMMRKYNNNNFDCVHDRKKKTKIFLVLYSTINLALDRIKTPLLQKFVFKSNILWQRKIKYKYKNSFDLIQMDVNPIWFLFFLL